MKAVKRTVGGGAILALLSTGLVFASGPASALPRQGNCGVIESNYNNAIDMRNDWTDKANAAFARGDQQFGSYAVTQVDWYEGERVGYAQDFMANDC